MSELESCINCPFISAGAGKINAPDGGYFTFRGRFFPSQLSRQDGKTCTADNNTSAFLCCSDAMDFLLGRTDIGIEDRAQVLAEALQGLEEISGDDRQRLMGGVVGFRNYGGRFASPPPIKDKVIELLGFDPVVKHPIR